MKKYLELFIQTVVILATLFLFLFILKEVKIGYPFMWELISKSQLVPAVVTFLVGLVALWVYWKQRDDKKRDMASLILQEIRYAEQKLREARSREHVYLFAYKLLPTNSWNKNIHLFVSDLEENQIDTISSFYSNAAFIDQVVEHIANDAMSSVPAQTSQSVPIPSAVPINGQSGDQKQIQLEISLLPAGAAKILREVSERVEFIYNSSAADVLRKIAKKSKKSI